MTTFVLIRHATCDPVGHAIDSAVTDVLPRVVVPDLLELDFGDWTGRSIAELEAAEAWRGFNVFRSGTRIPGGELMTEVQARAVGALERLSRQHPTSTIAVVSHGDVIRAMLVYFLGMPLDLLQRIAIDPASVSVLRLDPFGATVLRMNTVARWPDGREE